MDWPNRIEDYLVTDLIPHEIRGEETEKQQPPLPENKPKHDDEDPQR